MSQQPCPACGTAAAADAEFCASPGCRAYLRWDRMAAATPPAQQPTKAPPHPPKRVGPSLRVEIADPALAVEPGQSVATTVTIHNLGHQVEELAIGVVGPAAAFSAVDPPTLKLYPGTATTCALRFSPPRVSTCPSGQLGYGVQASSRLNNRVAAGASAAIVVRGYTDLTAELVPEAARKRLRSVQYLTLTNNGNEVQRVHLSAADRENALRFELPPAAVDVPPGRIAVPVLVRSRPALIGAGTRHPFDVAVSGADGTRLTRAAGTRITPAWLPSWLLAAAAALVVLAMLGGGIVGLTRLRPVSGNASGVATPATPPAPAAAPADEQRPDADPAASQPAAPSESLPPEPTPPGEPDKPAGGNPQPGPPQLTVTVAPVNQGADLTAEGAADWVHWGHRASDDTAAGRIDRAVAQECPDAKCANRKGVTPVINTFDVIGTAAPNRLRDPQAPEFSWRDGTPIASVAAAKGCVTVTGFGRGFRVTVNADNKLRTARLYVGIRGAQANLSAELSGGGTQPVKDSGVGGLDQPKATKFFVVQIRYRARGPQQTLTVSYTVQSDAGGGTVSLHAASVR